VCFFYSSATLTEVSLCFYLSCKANASSGVPWNVFRGGVQKIQLKTEDRERGSGGGSPLVRGSGGSCNLVQEISFHIVNFS
jgi:hypothetical protein